MNTSIFLAKVFGLYFVIVGIIIILLRNEYRKMLQGYINKPFWLIIGGIVSLMLGVILVTVHNIWVMDWVLIITLLSYLTLAKGIVLLLTAKKPPAFMKKTTDSKVVFAFCICLVIVLGLYLSWMGFFQ